MGLWSVQACWHCYSVLLSRRTLQSSPAPWWGPSHRRQSFINFSNAVVPKQAFYLVQKAYPPRRVEVSGLLLLSAVPAYTHENKASSQVLNSYWYSKQQSVLCPECYHQVPSRSGSMISRFVLSMPFFLARYIVIHSSQKKLLEHLAFMLSFGLTMEGDILAYRNLWVSLVCPVGTVWEL